VSVSFGERAVDLHFNVMIHLVRGVAPAVKADIPAVHPSGIDQTALVGFDILLVFSDTQSGGVVMVVVVYCLDIGDEVRVVCDLDDHVPVDPGLAVVMPDENSIQRAGSAEVDLHPLNARTQFHIVSLR